MRIAENIIYGERPGRSLALDLYRPDGWATGTVVLAHGGGFFKGDRRAKRVPLIAKKLTEQGLAVASIDYRLATPIDAFHEAEQRSILQNRQRALKSGVRVAKRMLGPAFEAARQDLGSAIAFLRANNTSFDVQSDKVSVLGISSGGIAALALAYPPQNLSNLPKPDAVLTLGAALVHIWALTPDGPPVLMIHSQQDRIISPQNALLARAAGQQAGASLDVLICDRRGHNAPVLALLQDDAPDGTPYWDHMLTLFSKAGLLSPSRAGV